MGPPPLGLVAFPKEEGSGQRLLHIPQSELGWCGQPMWEEALLPGALGPHT